MSVVAELILVTLLALGAVGLAVLIYALVRMTKNRVPSDFFRPSRARPSDDHSEVPPRE